MAPGRRWQVPTGRRLPRCPVRRTTGRVWRESTSPAPKTQHRRRNDRATRPPGSRAASGFGLPGSCLQRRRGQKAFNKGTCPYLPSQQETCLPYRRCCRTPGDHRNVRRTHTCLTPGPYGEGALRRPRRGAGSHVAGPRPQKVSVREAGTGSGWGRGERTFLVGDAERSCH